MNKVFCGGLFFFVVFFTGAKLAAADMPKPGQELIKYYAQQATARKQQGYMPSAVSGFKEGASYGAIVGLPAAIARSSQYIPPVSEWSSYLVAPIMAAAAIGGFAGAAASMWDEAFNRNSTQGWLKQMKLLSSEDGNGSKYVDGKAILLAGVPTDLVNETLEKNYKKPGIVGKLFDRDAKYIRKTYLVSSTFSNLENADNGNHYEIYLMPKDEHLIDVFLGVNEILGKSSYKEMIDFIALRPTPGVTKSPYNSKNMARIIIGFAPWVNMEIVGSLIEKINNLTIDNKPIAQFGLGIQPRYSQKLNDLIYVAYGSADYKEGADGQKEYAAKPKTLFQRFWSGLSDEAMAFPNDNLAIRTMPVAVAPITTDASELEDAGSLGDDSEAPLTYKRIEPSYDRPEIYIDEGPEVEAIKAQDRERNEQRNRIKSGGVPVEWKEL